MCGGKRKLTCKNERHAGRKRACGGHAVVAAGVVPGAECTYIYMCVQRSVGRSKPIGASVKYSCSLVRECEREKCVGELEDEGKRIATYTPKDDWIA